MSTGSLATLARFPMARLRRVRSWLPPLGWLALAVAGALVARRGATAPDAVLLAVWTLALPLAALALVTTTCGRGTLRAAVAPQVGLGASPRGAALAVLGATGLAAGVFGALGGALVVLGGGGGLLDALTTAWISALAGATYAALFTAASFGKHGWGRSVALVTNWVLGAGGTTLALLSPHAHLRNLLGGTPVRELPQWSATLGLALLFALFAAVTARRLPS